MIKAVGITFFYALSLLLVFVGVQRGQSGAWVTGALFFAVTTALLLGATVFRRDVDVEILLPSSMPGPDPNTPSLAVAIDSKLSALHWPEELTLSDRARAVYCEGLDLINSYSGDPDTLESALALFAGCGCSALAQAGIAAVLIAASYEHDDEYDLNGLSLASARLATARGCAPGEPDIDHLAVLVAIFTGRREDARALLDSMHLHASQNFFVACAELRYARSIDSIERIERWQSVALRLANSEARSFFINRHVAYHYFARGNYARAIPLYRQLAALQPENPWIWHNLSIGLLWTDQLPEAATCNARALDIMEFPAARSIQSAIRFRRSLFGSAFWRLSKRQGPAA